MSFGQLHRDLCSSRAQGLLSHRTALLTLDRSLSPAGARRLKDLRCLGRGAEFAWPSPGVYTPLEIASRLLTQEARLWQRPSRERRAWHPLETICHLLESGAGKDPLEALSFQRAFKRLRPIGIDFRTWSEILQDFEGGDAPELKSWTRWTLAWLGCCARAESEGRCESDWYNVALAVQVLRADDFSLDPVALLERDPFFEASPQLLVPAYVEAHPLEKQLIEGLARHMDVQWLRPASGGIVPAIASGELARGQGAIQEAGIFWARSESLPGQAEAAHAVPGSLPLDLEKAPGASSALARAFYLAAEYESLGEPGAHPFEQGPAHAALLQDVGLGERFDLDRSLAWLGEQVPSAAAALERVGGLPPTLRGREHFAAWARVFYETGLLAASESTAAPAHERIRADGIPILGLLDLPLAGCARMALWGDAESLKTLLDPLAPENLRKRLLPADLEARLAARGASLPDPAREALLLRDALAEISEGFFFLSPSQEAQNPAQEPPPVNFTIASKPLSPTALQAYFRCPFRYLADRQLRLNPDEAWDAESPSPLRSGSWIHKSLESFFAAPDWEQPEPLLARLLSESVGEFFEFITPSYREVLLAQARVHATRLARHVRDFERPLLQLFPQRLPPVTEMKLDVTLKERRLSGKMDRIDVLHPRSLLLWDYKTGLVSGKPKALIAKGEFQWFLYGDILRALPAVERAALGFEEGAKVAGGGYLNPLRPERSQLFVDMSAGPEAEILAAFLEKTPHAFHRISEEEGRDIEDQLQSALQHCFEGLERGDFNPKPLKAQECQRCSHGALCGRPSLIEAAP